MCRLTGVRPIFPRAGAASSSVRLRGDGARLGFRAMDLTFSERELAFRDELRAWLAANDPGPEPAEEKAHYAWRRDFQRRLYEGGWAAVHWPPEHGGRGATLTESAIFFEELGRARAPLPPTCSASCSAGRR